MSASRGERLHRGRLLIRSKEPGHEVLAWPSLQRKRRVGTLPRPLLGGLARPGTETKLDRAEHDLHRARAIVLCPPRPLEVVPMEGQLEVVDVDEKRVLSAPGDC